jgi:hypothetical protein
LSAVSLPPFSYLHLLQQMSGLQMKEIWLDWTCSSDREDKKHKQNFVFKSLGK